MHSEDRATDLHVPTPWHSCNALSMPLLLQMVLNTSPDVGDLREVMNYIYEDIYVEYVVRNPLYMPGQPFK